MYNILNYRLYVNGKKYEMIRNNFLVAHPGTGKEFAAGEAVGWHNVAHGSSLETPKLLVSQDHEIRPLFLVCFVVISVKKKINECHLKAVQRILI
jgi:hypothetical protein